jgi:hypothetical protein
MATWPGPGFLSSRVLSGIKTALGKAVDDTDLGAASISYKRLNLSSGGSATYNPATGAITDPHSAKTITCIVGMPTDQDARLFRAEFVATDRKFLIDRADLAADPQAGDLIVYSSTTFEVVFSLQSEPTGLVVVFAKALGGEA